MLSIYCISIELIEWSINHSKIRTLHIKFTSILI